MVMLMFCMKNKFLSRALKINSPPPPTLPHTHTSSTRFTGNWLPTLNLITLSSSEARIFSRTLHSPEVQLQHFNFTVHSNDPKSVAFLKLLRKKADVVRRVLK